MQSSSASVDDFLHIFTSKEQKQLDLSNLQNNSNQKNFKQEVQGLQAFVFLS